MKGALVGTEPLENPFRRDAPSITYPIFTASSGRIGGALRSASFSL